jgi:hypothetical protein
VEEVAVGLVAMDEGVRVAPAFSSSRIIGLVGARQTGKVELCAGDSDAGMLGGGHLRPVVPSSWGGP